MFSPTMTVAGRINEFSDGCATARASSGAIQSNNLRPAGGGGMIACRAIGSRTHRKKVTAPIVNAQFAPDLRAFLERGGIKVEADPADYSAGQPEIRDAVLVIDPDFATPTPAVVPRASPLVTERAATVRHRCRLARAVRSWREYGQRTTDSAASPRRSLGPAQLTTLISPRRSKRFADCRRS